MVQGRRLSIKLAAVHALPGMSGSCQSESSGSVCGYRVGFPTAQHLAGLNFPPIHQRTTLAMTAAWMSGVGGVTHALRTASQAWPCSKRAGIKSAGIP